MLQSNQKTSLLVPYQLPAYIRDNPDYSKFIAFLQAYYEWMEENGNTIDFTKNILNYMDVDTTTEQFMQYFLNDFMSYFPTEILADQSKVIKIAKQLYQSKGTPASYQFLFRVLYNSDVDFFYTKDVVLKASAGKWYVPRSLKLATSDPNFLSIQNLRLFGNLSKSIATVEAATYDGLKTEVFISNIERLFQSGETVTVVDNRNQPVYFLNGNVVTSDTPGAETLTALIVGQISQVLIDPNNRGEKYKAGDPVVLVGGLNPNVANPIGATVEVGSVTSGSVQRIAVASEGYGYTKSDANSQVGAANTLLQFSNLVGSSPQAPIAIVGTLDSSNQANATFIPTDSIQLKINHPIGNTSASSGANVLVNGFWSNGSYSFANVAFSNANTSLINALSFISIQTGPISSVIVENQGGGLSGAPSLSALSLYNTDNHQQTNLANLGILAPIQIINAGTGYANNDQIALIGGSGYGAYANVTQVASNGAIISVSYVANSQNKISLGGMGYNNSLPIAVVKHVATGTVTSHTYSNVVTGTGTTFTSNIANGAPLVTSNNIVLGTVQSVVNANTLILTTNANANTTTNNFYLSTATLSVPGTLGTGASFSMTTNRIGAITSFNVLDNGEDYISTANVSLKVQDMIVTNVSSVDMPSVGDTVYQGANINTATYVATVAFLLPLENFTPANTSIYQMRVFNYSSTPTLGSALKIDSKGAAMQLVGGYTTIHNTTFDNSINNTQFDSANGVITYGDGHAKATATFLNGLVIGNGQYLDTSGQPSSYDVLQSTIYNNFTYEITLSKEIAKYRDVLLNLLHPTGMQVIGRIGMTSTNTMNFLTEDALYTGKPLSYYTNTGSTAKISAGTASNPSNNIITFTNLLGANLANIFVANTSYVSFSYGLNYDDAVESLVVGINNSSNSITLQDNVWTYFANVATGTAHAGNNYIINISTLTGSYDIVNNGNYSNTQLPMADVIRVGDLLTVNGVAQTVTSITYSTNIANSVVVLSGPLTSGANGLISIGRNLISIDDSIKIFGPVGTQYLLELATEDGKILITEDGNALLIG